MARFLIVGDERGGIQLVGRGVDQVAGVGRRVGEDGGARDRGLARPWPRVSRDDSER